MHCVRPKHDSGISKPGFVIFLVYINNKTLGHTSSHFVITINTLATLIEVVINITFASVLTPITVSESQRFGAGGPDVDLYHTRSCGYRNACVQNNGLSSKLSHISCTLNEAQLQSKPKNEPTKGCLFTPGLLVLVRVTCLLVMEAVLPVVLRYIHGTIGQSLKSGPLWHCPGTRERRLTRGDARRGSRESSKLPGPKAHPARGCVPPREALTTPTCTDDSDLQPAGSWDSACGDRLVSGNWD